MPLFWCYCIKRLLFILRLFLLQVSKWRNNLHHPLKAKYPNILRYLVSLQRFKGIWSNHFMHNSNFIFFIYFSTLVLASNVNFTFENSKFLDLLSSLIASFLLLMQHSHSIILHAPYQRNNKISDKTIIINFIIIINFYQNWHQVQRVPHDSSPSQQNQHCGLKQLYPLQTPI